MLPTSTAFLNLSRVPYANLLIPWSGEDKLTNAIASNPEPANSTGAT